MSTDRALEAELREAALEDAQASWAYPEPRYTSRSALLEKAADALLALSEEVGRLKEALTFLCDEIEATELHGGGADDGDCPICRAIKRARILTPPSSQPGNSEGTR